MDFMLPRLYVVFTGGNVLYASHRKDAITASAAVEEGYVSCWLVSKPASCKSALRYVCHARRPHCSAI